MMAEIGTKETGYTPKGYPYRVVLWGNSRHQKWSLQVEGKLASGRRCMTCPPIRNRPLSEVMGIAEGILLKGEEGPALPFTIDADHRWMADRHVANMMLEKRGAGQWAIVAHIGDGCGWLSVREEGGERQTAHLTAEELRELARAANAVADEIDAEIDERLGAEGESTP